jgi:type VI secretion system protein ImpL
MPAIDGGQLPRYLSSVARLGRNLQRYDTVSFVGAEDTELQNLASLVQYLFAEELPPEFLENKRYHRTALWESYGQRITPRDRPRYNSAIVDRSELLLRNYYDGLIYRLEDINTRFQSAESVQRLTSADLADFRQLRAELGDVQRVLDGSEPFWFDETKSIGPSLVSILDSIPTTPITSPKAIKEQFTRTFYRVRREKLQELNQRLDPFQAGATAVSRRSGSSMALSPQLATLQTALDSLFSQPFISSGPPLTARAAVPAPGTRVRWDVAGLDRALLEQKRYEAFVARRQAQGDPTMNHLVEGLALVQLEARLTDAVRRSMIQAPPSYTFGLRDRERDLRNRIADFQEPSRRLVQLLGIADRLGLTDCYDEVADIYASQALSMLADVDGLLEEGGAYRPAGGSLSGWDGTQPPIYVAFRARDADELDRYLTEQRTRVSYLVTNFAAPLLAGLTTDPLSPYLHGAGEGASGLVSKWSGIVKELDRFEARAGTSSVEVLEKFVREEMTVADLRRCAINSGRSVSGGDDFFLAARNRLRAQLYTRCQQLVVTRAQQSYDRLQRFFNANLAGRYPFSRDLSANAPEAEIASVRQFFGLYDQLGDFRTAVPSRDASSFLDRMQEVRAFLQPLLQPDTTPGGPAFNVGVDFRANRDQERGADQIVDWTLALGGAPLTYRGQTGRQSATWRPGAPAALSLRWALQSAERPIRPRDGGVSVQDRDARFRYTGQWALLRLIQSHAAPGNRTNDGYLLQFEVPTARVGNTGSVAAEDAQLFIQLRLDYATAGPPPPFPVFPIRAPATSRQTTASRTGQDLSLAPSRMMDSSTPYDDREEER